MFDYSLLRAILLIIIWLPSSSGVALQLPSNPDQGGATYSAAGSGLPAEHAPSRSRSANFLLGEGDLLQISIFGASDFDQQARVDPAGNISLPLVGTIHIGGLTLGEAKQLVQQRLAEGHFYKNPQVSLFVKEYASSGVYLLGEVQKPGFYPLLNDRHLLEVLAIAGGLTPRAGTTATITNGRREQARLILTLSTDNWDNPELLPGDTITVSKAGIVYVVGDVHTPTGVIMEHGGLTVLQAIAMAQGTNSTAALDHARLIRRSTNGPTEIPFSLKRILAAKSADLVLQPNDIVFVPNSRSKTAGKRGIEAVIQAATGIAIWGRF